MRKIARIIPAVQAAWLAAERAKPISRTTLATFVFYLTRRFRFTHRWPFSFRWHGIPFWARHIDMVAVEEILLNDEYGFAASVLSTAAGRPTIIDGGANIGIFSLYVLGIRPDAMLYSVEPSLQTFRLLARNTRASRKTKWQAVHAALWKENGQIPFRNTEASTASRLAVFSGESDGQIEQVPAITLESFARAHVSGRITLLKLDVEGAEEAVLEAGSAILPLVDHLIVEIHPSFSDEERVMQLIHENFIYVHHRLNRVSVKPLIFASRTCQELLQRVSYEPT